MSKPQAVAPELWPVFSRLLNEAFALPAEQRLAWVDRLAPQHDELRAALIAAIQAAAAPPAQRPEPPQKPEAASAFKRGQVIGPYRLVELLGQGGMGEVWQAERIDAGLDRDVALKLPHASLTPLMRARLSRERDILASLAHPNIAQIHDAGVADDGQPWLALELVRGSRIREYCNNGRLNLVQRLQLFMQVIDAVRAAHARLIVHRDLKPANILVTHDGRVKLLDFGIAKLLIHDGTTEQIDLTRIGGPMATPEYAAPEQLVGGEITVATDIYALGVVLFELLCGCRPHHRRGWEQAGQVEPAVLASDKLTDAQAKLLGLTPHKARKRLGGDIDAILVKAMEAEPGQRYLSAEQMADDLQRHLELRPIRARHITRSEQALRFVRRNRVPVALAAAVAISLLAGIAGVAWQAHRAATAAAEARAEAERATALKDLLLEVFNIEDRSIARDRSAGAASARDMLNLAVRHAETRMAAHPEIQLELYAEAAGIYNQWDDLPRFHEMNARRRELATRIYGPTHAEAIYPVLSEAQQRLDAADPQAAQPLLAEADQLIRAGGHDESLLRADWWEANADLNSRTHGAVEDRLRDLKAAAGLYLRVAPEDVGRASILSGLALELYNADEVASAEQQLRDAEALLEAAQGKDRNDRLLSEVYGNLGLFRWQLGDTDRAEQAMRKAMDLDLRTYGRDDASYWIDLSNLAQLLHWRGERQRADAMMDQASQDIQAADPAQVHEARVFLGFIHAGCLVAEGRPQAAVPLLEWAATQDLEGNYGLIEPAEIQFALGAAYAAAGRAQAARPALAQGLQHYLRNPHGRRALEARERWGRFLLEQGDLAGAATQFEAVIEGGKPGGVALPMARSGLAGIARRRGKVEEALQLSGQALQELEQQPANFDVRIWPQLWRSHAQILDAAGQRAEARVFRERALEASRQYDDRASATRKGRGNTAAQLQ